MVVRYLLGLEQVRTSTCSYRTVYGTDLIVLPMVLLVARDSTTGSTCRVGTYSTCRIQSSREVPSGTTVRSSYDMQRGFKKLGLLLESTYYGTSGTTCTTVPRYVLRSRSSSSTQSSLPVSLLSTGYVLHVAHVPQQYGTSTTCVVAMYLQVLYR